MADDLTYTSTAPAGPPNATKQVTDEHATRGHMPVVKLAVSTDGSASLLQADADGILVNLGANNDVTVTSGTVTIGAGGATIGTVDLGTPPGSSSATVTDDTTVTSVAETLAANSARRGLIVMAASTNTQSCFIRFGGTASATSWTVELVPGAHWESLANVYTGAISYVAASGTQTLHLTEW